MLIQNCFERLDRSAIPRGSLKNVPLEGILWLSSTHKEMTYSEASIPDSGF